MDMQSPPSYVDGRTVAFPGGLCYIYIYDRPTSTLIKVHTEDANEFLIDIEQFPIKHYGQPWPLSRTTDKIEKIILSRLSFALERANRDVSGRWPAFFIPMTDITLTSGARGRVQKILDTKPYDHENLNPISRIITYECTEAQLTSWWPLKRYINHRAADPNYTDEHRAQLARVLISAFDFFHQEARIAVNNVLLGGSEGASTIQIDVTSEHPPAIRFLNFEHAVLDDISHLGESSHSNELQMTDRPYVPFRSDIMDHCQKQDIQDLSDLIQTLGWKDKNMCHRYGELALRANDNRRRSERYGLIPPSE